MRCSPTSSSDPILIGQIQLVDVPHPSKARQLLEQRKEEVLNLANSLHPRMVARGGGAVDLRVRLDPFQIDFGQIIGWEDLQLGVDQLGRLAGLQLVEPEADVAPVGRERRLRVFGRDVMHLAGGPGNTDLLTAIRALL